MQPFFPTLALLSDLLPGALGVVGAVVASFILITLVSSYYRFQHIVQQAEDTQPEEMGLSAADILRVQLARYLAACARRGSSFSLSLIQVNDSSLEVRMDAPLIIAIKTAARCDDVTCIYDQHAIALLMEAEPEDAETILTRITETVASEFPSSTDLFRVGIASYPEHGLSGPLLIDVANEGLAQSDAIRPIVLSEIVDEEEDSEKMRDDEGQEALVKEPRVEDEAADEEPEVRTRRQRRKSSMLDELTGVLKPSAVSAYMQRMMSDLRYKKKKASLFCIGVNNIEHIERFHGQKAADDVMVGVSKVLQEYLRADDLIGRHEKYAFLVLVQSSLDEAETVGKRISTLVQHCQMASGNKKIKVTITLGVAAYPEHGRNLHALYQAGQKVLDYSRANDIRAYAVYDPEIHASMPSKPMKSIKSIEA
jgi:diguanylate cyclase (GGDEF)-like protein